MNQLATLSVQQDRVFYGDLEKKPVSYAYLKVIDEICEWAWQSLDSVEIINIATVYYYFSVQFRENLEIACLLYPNDQLLKKLYHGECNTDNLSPCPPVTTMGEKLNHDEFMHRLLALEPLAHTNLLDDIGLEYLNNIRSLDATARAASIATYEDGGLSRVFSAMLRARQWQGTGQQAFKFFLEEHIRFDIDEDNGHGALARHLRAGDEVLPLWLGFKDILLAAVPKLAAGPLRLSLSVATSET